MRVGLALAASVLALAACQPMTREAAERSCWSEARLAEAPRGEVRLGAAHGAGGTRMAGGASLTLSSDFLMGRSPEEVWRRCVMNRSGEMPSRAYSEVRSWDIPPQVRDWR